MTPQEFVQWLKGYLDGKKSSGGLYSDLAIISNKLYTVGLDLPFFDPNKIYGPSPITTPSYPGTGVPYVGDPLPGQEPKIVSGETWTTNTTDQPFVNQETGEYNFKKEKIQLNG